MNETPQYKPDAIWPPWWMTVLAVLIVMGFTSLAWWQYQRGVDKQDRAELTRAMAVKPPLSITNLNQWREVASYRPVRVTGQWVSEPQLLLDNRLRDGEFGMEAVTALQLPDGARVAVARGWFAVSPSQRRQAQSSVASAPVDLQGHLGPLPPTGLSLGKSQRTDSGDMLAVAITSVELEKWLKLDSGQRVLRLDETSPGALAVRWTTGGLPPERHFGYAFQWGALALLVASVYVILVARQWQRGRGRA